MNHPQAAKVILSAVGGIENIISADHCATRMRFVLRDEAKANDGAIKALEGVLDVVRSGGQYQIVVGPDVVRLYSALLALDGFEALAKGSGEAEPAPAPNPAGTGSQEPSGLRSWLRLATSTLAALFVPIIPALTAAGLLQCIVLMLAALGLMDPAGLVYQIFYQIGRAPFYYLPFLLAYTSARRFKVDVSLALLMAGVLMSPSLAELLLADTRFLDLLPLFFYDYAGSVLPIILIVWLMSRVSRLAEAHSPESVKFFSVPLLIVLLGGIPGWLFLAPLGYLAGNALTAGITLLANYANWLPVALIGAFNPLMVMSGTHYPLVALGISNLSSFSYDSIVGPGMLASNLAQGSAALAAALVTRSKTVRRQGVGAGITALLGITEPALFGCNLRLRYPLWGALIGGGAGGLFMGLFRVRRYTYGSPGLLVLPGYLGGQDNRNFFFACIGCAIAIIVSFCATIAIAGIREWKTNLSLRGCTVVDSPIRGQVVALRHVPDKVFSSGLMGAGCAVMPEDNKVYAPFDGVVRSIAHTGHAIGLSGANGVSLLIHVGINTVYLHEPCFRPAVRPDQQVKKGDLLMTFDLKAIQDGGCSPVVPIVIPEFDGTAVCPPEGCMVDPTCPLLGLKGEKQ